MSKPQQLNEIDNNNPNIELRKVTEWPAEEIVKLYKAGGWWKEQYDIIGIPALIKGSFAFIIALENSKGKDRAIGMGRAISDGVSDTYIQDIVVLDEWRGKGIGSRIIKTLIEYCKEKKLLWIGLIAEPGTSTFYLPLGFKPLPGEPMVYEPEG